MKHCSDYLLCFRAVSLLAKVTRYLEDILMARSYVFQLGQVQRIQALSKKDLFDLINLLTVVVKYVQS